MNTDELFDALERCAATSSKKAKLEIVKGLGREATFWLKAALDPTIAYYVAKLPKYPKSGAEALDPDVDGVLLRRLATREISGNEALQRIDDTMRELMPKSQEVLRRVILKDLRCGVGTTIVNSAFPGLIPVFPYMRCVLEKDSNMAKWNWAEGMIVQLKADGAFANVNVEDDGVVNVFTRQGSPYPAGGLGGLERDLRDALDRGTQTHGEMLVYDADGMLLERQIGNGVLNSLLAGGELPKGLEVRFFAWDQIPIQYAVDKGRYEIPYGRRLLNLERQISATNSPKVQVIPTHRDVRDMAGAMAIYKGYLAEGLEGVIVKHPNALWRDGDNKDQVKLKQEVDVDLEVEAILPGNDGTKNEGRAGRVTMRTSDHLLKVNVAVKNEAMRDVMDESPEAFIGKIMVVRANGVMYPSESNELHSLFLPRFVELCPRTDKTEADSLERVIAQFDAAVTA